MTRHILSLSGGLDSAVLCAFLLAEHGPGSVDAVFFQYGSKHGPWEEKAARTLAAHFSLPLAVIDLGGIFRHAQSALLESDTRSIPTQDYDAESMSQTVVPGRNLIFASVLASLAESRSIPGVALATHAGDHHVYPDCRPSFNLALDRVLQESSGGAVRVVTPFQHLSKTRIVAMGATLGVPFALTRSCYGSEAISCGQCGTCRERLQAFADNNLTDPVAYHHPD